MSDAIILSDDEQRETQTLAFALGISPRSAITLALTMLATGIRSYRILKDSKLDTNQILENLNMMVNGSYGYAAGRDGRNLIQEALHAERLLRRATIGEVPPPLPPPVTLHPQEIVGDGSSTKEVHEMLARHARERAEEDAALSQMSEAQYDRLVASLDGVHNQQILDEIAARAKQRQEFPVLADIDDDMLIVILAAREASLRGTENCSSLPLNFALLEKLVELGSLSKEALESLRVDGAPPGWADALPAIAARLGLRIPPPTEPHPPETT